MKMASDHESFVFFSVIKENAIRKKMLCQAHPERDGPIAL